jgi:hypothetical protein
MKQKKRGGKQMEVGRMAERTEMPKEVHVAVSETRSADFKRRAFLFSRSHCAVGAIQKAFGFCGC